MVEDMVPFHSIRGVLRPAFQMAVDDDLILKIHLDLNSTVLC